MSKKNSGFVESILEYSNTYWIVNVMELLERLAYYGVRSVIALYMVLPRELGGPELTHKEKGIIFLWWAAFQSLLPMFTGGFADRYGHKKTIVVAILIKIAGYIMMAQFQDFWGFFSGCMFLAIGTAIFKPGVQGTLALNLKNKNASLGWAIFYQIVNVGGFLGPVVAGLLRMLDWSYVFYNCAAIVALNFLWLPFYDDPSKNLEKTDETPFQVFYKSILGLFRPRLLFFCLAFSGFWVMFHQIFDLLPNVIHDWVDSSDVVEFAGNALAIKAVPMSLSIFLSVAFGSIFGLISFLSLRPDITRKPSNPALFVFALTVFFASAAMFSSDLTKMWIPALFAVTSAVVYRLNPLSPKMLFGFMLIVGAASVFPILSGKLANASSTLITMAKNGQQINPEWMININAALIVTTMAFFGYLTSFISPLASILLGMAIAIIGGMTAGMATTGLACLGGIALFSIGEMLSSPKKMEYLSDLAPKGQEGLYMGYVNVPVAIGWMAGSAIAGERYEMMGDKINLAKKYLIDKFSMAPEAVEAIPRSEVVALLSNKLSMSPLEVQKLLFTTYHPEQIWYYIGGIGVGSLILMLVYDRVLKKLDTGKFF